MAIKVTLLTSEQASALYWEPGALEKMFFMDRNPRTGKLAPYYLDDPELPAIDVREAFLNDVPFFYDGDLKFPKHQARIMKVLDDGTEWEEGRYDFETSAEKLLVNERAIAMRKWSGVKTTYISEL